MAVILVTHGIPDAYKNLLKPHEVIAPAFLQSFSHAELLQHSQKADAVLACGVYDSACIEAGKHIRIIANYGSGYDGVDVKAAARKGIMVTNTPEETAYPTAEIAIGLMLSTARRVGELDRLMREKPTETLFGMGKRMGTGLFGNTLGIVGMGHIGSIVARFGKLMGMNVLYHNRHRVIDEHGAHYATLDALFAKSDIISLHCPLTQETQGLVSKAKLDLMKPRSVLVNTARGALVDYDALYEKLTMNEAFFAGLDVYPNEPFVPQKLLPLPNVVLTPHIGVNSIEARDAIACAAAKSILEALDGKRPKHIVNGL